MTPELDRRVTAARVPMPDDWTPTAATHCGECGDELERRSDRTWSRETCPRCASHINRAEFFDGLDGLEVW